MLVLTLLATLSWTVPALAQSEPTLPKGPPPPGATVKQAPEPAKAEYKFGDGKGALTCFATGTAAEMLVQLERCQKLAEQHETLREANAELIVQINGLKKIIEAQSEEISACNKRGSEYEKLMTEKDIACNQKIDAAKPGFWKTFWYGAGCVGIGLLLGLLL